MKNTVAYAVVLLCLFLSIQSCQKDTQHNIITSAPTQNQDVTAVIPSGQTFTFVAGNSGTLTVSRQASHYQLSETKTENGSVVYSYNSEPGYIGSDEVALSYLPGAAYSENNGGCPASHTNASATAIVIHLSVTK